MGTKGSLKDRVRFWNMQRKRKKEEKKRKEYEEMLQFQKEKQTQGIYIQIPTKKYNAFQKIIQIFFGFFIGLFTLNKKPEKSIKNRTEAQLLTELIVLQEEIKKMKETSIPLYYQKIEQKERQIEQLEQKHSKVAFECTNLVQTERKSVRQIKNSDIRIYPTRTISK